MTTAQQIEIERKIRSVLEDPRLIERLVQKGKDSVSFWLPEPSLPPVIFIATYDPREADQVLYHIVLVDGPFNGPEKQLVIDRLAREMHVKRAVPLAIMLASETWVSKNMVNPDGSRRYDKPEDDPEREERVTIQVLTADGKAAVTSCSTERREGQLHLVGAWEPTNPHYKAQLLSRFYLAFLCVIESASETVL